jgi:heme oxygenase
VDSLLVYETLDEIVNTYPVLTPFRNTGLERTIALKKDLLFLASYDAECNPIPECGSAGKAYREVLLNLAATNIPKFMCHYYNHYFAHTAGLFVRSCSK